MASENISMVDEHIHVKEKNMQKMLKCGRRVVLEGAPVEEEQDKVHHRPPISEQWKKSSHHLVDTKRAA